MQNETVSPNGVYISGTFNNWNYAQNFMTLSSGTIYETSMIMDEGTYMEFKYANGFTVNQAETVPGACSLNGNRYFTVPAHDTVLTAYCFSSCNACGTVAHYSHVTFRVDMITQNISPNGVHIAGTFQGWNTSSTPMVNTVDSVFSFTDSLLTGTSVQYRFVNGNSDAGYETVPFSCSLNGNRTLLVPAEDIIIQLVCFSACDTCILTGSGELTNKDFSLSQNFPNPVSGNTNISYTIGQAGLLKLALYSPMGQLVSVLMDGACEPGSFSLPINTSGLPAGIYFYQMTYTGQTGAIIKSKKMIVK
jgi:hypothetical protein